MEPLLPSRGKRRFIEVTTTLIHEEFSLYKNDRGEPFAPEWVESGTPSELRFDYDKCLLFIDGESFPIDCSSCAQSRVQINSSIIEISKLLRVCFDMLLT